MTDPKIYHKYRKDSTGKICIFQEEKYPSISPLLLEKVHNHALVEKDILEADPTDILRLAYIDEEVRKMMNKVMEFSSGLPLKEPYKLRDYQYETLRWMMKVEKNGRLGIRGGIVNLEMGLGKSLVALAHTLVTKSVGDFPTLIITGKTIMFEWKNEGVDKFFGSEIRVLFLHPSVIGKDRIHTLTRQDVLQYDMIITTYDICRMECERGNHFEKILVMGSTALHQHRVSYYRSVTREEVDNPLAKGTSIIFKTPWKIVVCDESQEFANPKTKLFRAMMSIYGKYKWCLTGTPVRNYNEDMWSQLRFLGYNGVLKVQEWSYQKFHDQNLSEFIITKRSTSLPPKIRDKTDIIISGREKKVYEYIVTATREAFEKSLNKLVSYANVLALFTRLRQCCIAPYLMTLESKRKKVQNNSSEQDATECVKNLTEKEHLGGWIHDKYGTAGINSAKLTILIDILRDIPKTDKVLIFSMFTSCLDLVADAIRFYLPEFKFDFCDGDVKGLKRKTVIEDFKSGVSHLNALLLTYKTGASGLNLTIANRVICIEPWWTFAITDQAESRSWRMGQEKRVIIHEITVANSIEKDIQNLCEEKRALSKLYLSGAGGSNVKMGLDKLTMRKLLRL